MGFYVPRTSAASLREKQSGWNNVAGVHIISCDTPYIHPYIHTYVQICIPIANAIQLKKSFLKLPRHAKKTKWKRTVSTTALFIAALYHNSAIPLILLNSSSLLYYNNIITYTHDFNHIHKDTNTEYTYIYICIYEYVYIITIILIHIQTCLHHHHHHPTYLREIIYLFNVSDYALRNKYASVIFWMSGSFVSSWGRSNGTGEGKICSKSIVTKLLSYRKHTRINFILKHFWDSMCRELPPHR